MTKHKNYRRVDFDSIESRAEFRHKLASMTPEEILAANAAGEMDHLIDPKGYAERQEQIAKEAEAYERRVAAEEQRRLDNIERAAQIAAQLGGDFQSTFAAERAKHATD